MSIGQAIKQVRQARKVSQVQLSELTGLAQNAISRIEKGENHPNQSTMQKLCDALGMEKEAFELLGAIISAKSEKLSPLKQKMAPLIQEELFEIYGLELPQE